MTHIILANFHFRALVQGYKQARMVFTKVFTARLLVHTVLLGLTIFFAYETLPSLTEFRAGKVARSTRDMFNNYIKFPTISLCLGESSDADNVGFDDMGTSPVNNSFVSLQFVRHFKNGYVNVLLPV